MERILITGMSGAGKSKAINALEDIGYYCVDNLPPQLLASLTSLRGNAETPLAVVIDARSQKAFTELLSGLDALDEQGVAFKIVFLDADPAVLLQRYKETRRKHPLTEKNSMSLEEAIERERELLRPIRERASVRIDTTYSLPAQLREQLVSMLAGGQLRRNLWVHCVSFGFKRGLPMDADLVFDVRCLPNPFYVPALKPLTGLDEPVRDYVFQFEQARVLLEKLKELLRYSAPLYQAEGRSQLVVAIGCTGGQHRSVAFAQALGSEFIEQGFAVTITHRDKDRASGG